MVIATKTSMGASKACPGCDGDTTNQGNGTYVILIGINTLHSCILVQLFISQTMNPHSYIRTHVYIIICRRGSYHFDLKTYEWRRRLRRNFIYLRLRTYARTHARSLTCTHSRCSSPVIARSMQRVFISKFNNNSFK